MNFPLSCIEIQYELSIFAYQSSIWTFHFTVSKFNTNSIHFRVSKFNTNFQFSCIKIQYELSISVYQN